MSEKKILTQDEVRKLFDYNPDTGFLTRKVRLSNRNSIGENVGSLTCRGYLAVSINRKKYLVHRLIWLYVNGDIKGNREIDHINHNTLDNRICNLRVVSHLFNMQNSSMDKRNKSGCNGVNWHKKSQKWRAYIRINWKHTHLGTFIDLQDAINARKTAELNAGFHFNHGMIKHVEDGKVEVR